MSSSQYIFSNRVERSTKRATVAVVVSQYAAVLSELVPEFRTPEEAIMWRRTFVEEVILRTTNIVNLVGHTGVLKALEVEAQKTHAMLPVPPLWARSRIW